MQIRRSVAALLTALALAGGGALTACSGPIGMTGTPIDKAKDTQGDNPAGASQGDLPLDSNRVTTTPADRAGGNHKGTP